MSIEASEMWGAEITNEYSKPNSALVIKGNHQMVNSFFYSRGSAMNLWWKMLEE